MVESGGRTHRHDRLWYKDALIYEVHVRAFADSNSDGVGDFIGLTQKLPYLQDLGITCIWLMPFFPSPLRDDGYDIADFLTINPLYGTLDDFVRFVDQAHARGIRVIVELVVNHTSDQHSWFQRARRAPAGSPERDFYVWRDTDSGYADARIIFSDIETSNWTWDPVAKAYFWHRFFSHQPDLNFDNPAVLAAVLEAMRFWLDLGVDGLRLDAITYLVEQEGTTCENLPQTHSVVKAIRRVIDEHYADRILLAEANQWPADVRPYFGDGDECHMAFHFPLMPRLFMAVRMEERHPVVEIMTQTPSIPETCQWALFLRSHDSLTLSKVTEEERDYMYVQYAADPLMRLNQGIRRRLAPLMENSRLRIELMNSLLFSMPGTPIIYYGDEIGMGDNVYLGDRNGVRTPMQWSSDRNAGFSRADPPRLYLPLIMDRVYSYEAINVEAQERSPYSLLHWMKRMLALRRQHKVFGCGSIEFIRTDNRKVLTYVRQYENQIVLCVANLARTAQPVSVPLAQFAGLTPVELFGQTEFPRITDQPYFLTLSPYGFYWFDLQDAVVPVTARVLPPQQHAELPRLLVGDVWDSVFDGVIRTLIERQALGPFLERQRWFGDKSRSIASVRVADWGTVRSGAHPAFLLIVEVHYRDGRADRCVLPLAMSSGDEADAVDAQSPEAVLARISGARQGLLYDGLFDDGTCATLLAIIQEGRDFPMRFGRLCSSNLGLTAEGVLPDALSLIRGPADRSNTSVTFDRQLTLKLFRRVESGPNPDVEISRFLTARGFANVPALVGALAYERPGEAVTSVMMLQRYVSNQGNGWQVTIEEIGRYLDRSVALQAPSVSREEVRAWIRSGRRDAPTPVVDVVRTYLATADIIGRRTGELHAALADAPDVPAFARESFTTAEITRAAASMRLHAEDAFRLLELSLNRLDERRRGLAAELLSRANEVRRHFDGMQRVTNGGHQIRCHGDYHLGQVLVTEGDIVILDFEGEPARTLAERGSKISPLCDVAGMIRSFGYAVLTGLGTATKNRPEDIDRLTPWGDFWEMWVTAAFLRAYLISAAGAGILPPDPDDFDALLQAYIADKALHELTYELNNRPEWAHVPLIGLLQLMAPPPSRTPHKTQPRR